MPSTNGTQVPARNRNALDFSDERHRDGLLRSAWIAIVAGFDCRPSPRGPWDETATGDQTPWKYVVAPIRGALASAVATGNRQLIEHTLEGARAFCHELEADFASLVPPACEESVLTLALEETKYQGPADEAAMALAAKANCPIEAERAIGPVARHAAALTTLLNCLRRSARRPHMRIAQW